ncbi:ABC transporter permease [Synechocystis sp. LKSZ1]|uniref:ABC transporter permease n=1 Tax=Synechocystis sp. LKSZ1 TaxID=3144951 RepID=UPI00336BEC71
MLNPNSLPPADTSPDWLTPVSAWQRFRQDRLALLGLGLLLILVLSVLFGPVFYRQSLTQIDFSQTTAPPSWRHPLGTNDLGQDQLARLLVGGRISLAVGVTAMALSIGLGTVVGALAGFYGGWLDLILMRWTELFLALPQLPLVLLVVYLFRDAVTRWLSPELGIFGLVVVLIGGLNWMTVARLVRANILKLREMEFMTAAAALGARPRDLIWRHLLPNVASLIIVAATLAVGNAIVTESTLSFLGLGFPPDIPTWGQMLFTAKDYLMTAPHLVLTPALAIILTVLSINYIGEGLRKALP